MPPGTLRWAATPALCRAEFPCRRLACRPDLRAPVEQSVGMVAVCYCHLVLGSAVRWLPLTEHWLTLRARRSVRRSAARCLLASAHSSRLAAARAVAPARPRTPL